MATTRATAKNCSAINPFKPLRAASAAGRNNFVRAAKKREKFQGAREEIEMNQIRVCLTWKHYSDEIPLPWIFEQKVDVFYHRVLGWQLHIADIVANGGKPLSEKGDADELKAIPHSGFAVLQICLSYFETIGKYQEVNRQKTSPTDFFKQGVYAVFPNLAKQEKHIADKFLDLFYEGARCGLYHSSITTPDIFLANTYSAMLFKLKPKPRLFINPSILPEALKHHLTNYCNELLKKENRKLRFNFEKRFNKENGIKS